MSASLQQPPVSTVALQSAGAIDLTIEKFHGTNAQLQSFVERTWLEAYAGKISFPVWSEQYFDWQLSRRGTEPDRRLAVYDSDKVVAVLLGTPHRFRVGSESLRGGHWSWLSVDGAYRGRGLAKALDQNRIEVERQAKSDLVVSYRYVGSRHSLAERPSSRFPLKKFHSKVGFWARPLDSSRLMKWSLNRAEGFLGRLVSPLLPKVRSQPDNLDSAEDCPPDKLRVCLELVREQARSSALSIDWDEDSLRHQFNGSPLSRTAFAESHGRVQGFVNYHILPFQGRTREPVGIIDVVAVGQLSSRLQRELMMTALGDMREQGAILALKMRAADSSSLMLRTGFVPRWPDSSLVLQWTNHVRNVPSKRPVHLLWR